MPDKQPKPTRIKETRPFTEGGHFSDKKQTRVRDLDENETMPEKAVEVDSTVPLHDWKEEENI